MEQILLALRIGLALLLYAILTCLFYVIWRSLGEGAGEAQSEAKPAVLVREVGEVPPVRVSLRTVTAVGRAPDNHVVVDDPFASANHAVIVWREDNWWVEDVESHNGTFLNDARVSGPTVLHTGDRIRVGETVLRFESG